MLKQEAIIDGILVTLNKVETSQEYREGARASGDSLLDSEGYLFEYDTAMKLQFENTGVPYDLRILYLHSIVSTDEDQQAVVMESSDMCKDSSKIASPLLGMYNVAIELRKDFCVKNKIGKGSIVTLRMVG